MTPDERAAHDKIEGALRDEAVQALKWRFGDLLRASWEVLDLLSGATVDADLSRRVDELRTAISPLLPMLTEESLTEAISGYIRMQLRETGFMDMWVMRERVRNAELALVDPGRPTIGIRNRLVRELAKEVENARAETKESAGLFSDLWSVLQENGIVDDLTDAKDGCKKLERWLEARKSTS